ncbi:cell envelope biogenesis protein OmpA [Flavivirga aquatica]|uniref:Cell envelope biogenesis protein OmpA n=1 Tax=Flavivirga aquatica TaxID=1849968 RepID=A0A1E5T8R1_9FLAO|nr:cell envelope biogenesis protein OmpA [Flavivirga aquatica]OEK07772.1 cell envelope biogenesis protein OmpA [Flavivirga aquatica]
MFSIFKIYKNIYLAICFVAYSFFGFSQGNTSTIKAQLALGINNPSSGGFVRDFESKPVNSPSINLGVQYMFKPKLGAKLDFGYNRFSNLNNTPEFKVNYTRLNLQLVFDANEVFNFSSQRLGAYPHIGPGLSMIKPLGDYTQNNLSFLNGMAGIEFHYGMSETLSLFVDTSYIVGFGKEFNPVSEGYGSFNGNLLTINFGLSISLSGCYFCEQ